MLRHERPAWWERTLGACRGVALQVVPSETDPRPGCEHPEDRRWPVAFRGAALLLLGGLLLALGCAAPPEAPGPRVAATPRFSGPPLYHLAVHPLHNPAKLVAAYQPLVDHLNGRLRGGRLQLEASRDYASFERKYRDQADEFLLPNPWQTLEAMQSGYHVIAMAGDPGDFRGLLLVRRDSGLERPGDLKGKTVSYPSATALAACIMPQDFLHRKGLDVDADLRNRYVGSQESAIMNTYLGLSQAGATWPPPWRSFQKEHPKEASALRVLCETEPLVNNSLMARDDVPQALQEQVRSLVVDMHRSPEGRAILAGMETARFLEATDADYEVVRRYVARFEREVRAVRPDP